ncbi:MAG: flippase-like domain-containing protein [Gammaproteobacteria bacterium]|nr:flippase-like domain-containing protein [Gammaproteobacteria bacterium]
MAIRVLVTAALLAAVWFLVDLPELARTFADLEIGALSVAVGLTLSLRVLSAFRWHVILAAHDVASSFRKLLKITFVSHSIGYMSPGGLGTEVARAYQAGAAYGEISSAISSVLVDRVIGLISMLVIAIAMGLYLSRSNPEFIDVVAGSALLLLAIAVAIAVASTAAGRKAVQLLPDRPPFGRIKPGLDRLVRTFTDHGRNVRLLAPISGLSLVMQIVRALTFWALFMAVGAEVSVLHCLVFIPLLFVALSLPISVGGIGVREGGLALLFSRVGVGVEESVATGLVFYALQLLFIVPGLVIFLLDPVRRPGSARHRGSPASRDSAAAES